LNFLCLELIALTAWYFGIFLLLLWRWLDVLPFAPHNIQEPHFQTVFAAGRACGWVDEAKHRIDHVPFGVVLGTDGKKFKTRSGDTVRLVGACARASMGWWWWLGGEMQRRKYGTVNGWNDGQWTMGDGKWMRVQALHPNRRFPRPLSLTCLFLHVPLFCFLLACLSYAAGFSSCSF
jgi:hypothetical protein